MSSYNPDSNDFDDEDFGPGEEDFVDSITCDECSKEIVVEFGDEPDRCPHCGTEFC